MTLPFKRILVATLLASSFAAVAVSHLQSEPEQSTLITDMLEKLTSSHYQKRPINDVFSKDLYEAYLSALDNSKSYLLESDINALKHWRLTLDDAIKKGKLDYAFEGFSRYKDNRVAQLQHNIQLLESDYVFNFDDTEALSQDLESRSWPKTVAERNEWWRKRMEAELLAMVLTDDAEKARDRLIKRYSNELKLVQETESRDVFNVYAGVVTTLFDPHTNYFSPSTSDSFNINMALSLEGIGAVLEREDDYIQVVRVVPGGPAAMQGELQAGDKIVAITNNGDSEPTDLIGWRLDDAVKLIRGPKDSVAVLQIKPGKASSSESIKVIEIVRDKVKLEEQAAQKEIVDITIADESYRVGVISIPTFYLDFAAAQRRDPNYKSTTKDVMRLMDELINQQNADGIILDLRANGGGALQEATLLTDLFINPGPVVQIRNSNGQINRSLRASRRAAYNGPLVVMIDRLSASASEIFAGAIQDYGRGVIVGSQSFGKGTVQTLLPLGKGQLKLTESKFYRVSGDSTQNHGVTPDIDFPNLYDPETIGESSQDNALQWDTIRPAPHKDFANLTDEIALLKKSHKARASKDPDFKFIESVSAINSRFAKENEQPLSLNLKEREQQVQQRKELHMAMENERRTAKGLEPYATVEAFEEASDALDTDSLPLAEKDPLLQEASHIVVDMIKLGKNPRLFAKQYEESKHK